MLSGRDMLVKARTGDGKTLGYLIPAIERLLKEKERAKTSIERLGTGLHRGPIVSPRILVLCPTRELAYQVVVEVLFEEGIVNDENHLNQCLTA